MTDDLGPGEMISDDLATIFAAYLVPAAGLAYERDAGDAAELLGAASAEDAAFSEFPITAEDGRNLASVDLVLRVPAELKARASEATREEIAEVLNEVVEPDGYRVRDVRVVG
jgi:hypothetical protein